MEREKVFTKVLALNFLLSAQFIIQMDLELELW